MSDSDYSDDEADFQPKRGKSTKASSKKVEDIYKKTNLREHILNRPDSYIGSIEMEKEKIFVMDEITSKFVQKDVTYAPGLLKIFDEILVNAADNKQRDPKGMTRLEVLIDPARNIISVYNNGMGIPVTLHQEYGIYVPELIFGQLLTSSNYDDTEKRTVGGRNGFGAKLANIFSTKFIIETHDRERRLTYKQVFTNNMVTTQEPEITKGTGPSWTKVTFQPDLSKFAMTELDEDIISLFKKRVYDIAGTCGRGLDVYLNGELLKIKDFKEYCKLYLPPTTDMIHEVINDRWEVIVAPSDGQFTQVSFVNRINTLRGGTHVNAVSDQCVKVLTDIISKKKKKVQLRPQHFRNHLWVFVNTLIENPTFDTQTKVNLSTRKTAFGSPCELSEKFTKSLAKSSIVASILEFATFQENKELKKNDAKKKTARLLGVAKLEDANKAGTRESSKCTLIITEGDSAKSLAMAGLSVVGRDYFGVFPIRGKLLNVRDASAKQIVENSEISDLKKIIGLQQNKKYKDTSDLRYGHIMIMTDQDHDGSHIKGLIINMFATFWPSLLELPGFLVEFITPIVKVTRGKTEKAFYTIPEYEEWKEANNNGKGWVCKYYKGLGTSSAADAKRYFANIDRHRIEFMLHDIQCLKRIEMAFSKTAANDRKAWMQAFIPGTFLDQNVPRISYQEFIDKELILFSIASNQRAIPCIVDGLKPGQRKVLFSCFKRNLTKEIKVQQLAGYVSEKTAYHHGEASLASTIVNLAQNYVGANNINYLWPSGQFGTRAQGGKDAASVRYIYTYLSPVTRAIFHPDDDALLTYLNDDGQSIEPEYYVPVLPTVLVNGSSGIGTGWSSDIPNHNPREIVENIRRMLQNEEPEEMHPYYKGFIGEMAVRGGRRGTYYVRGLLEEVAEKPCTVHVYELAIGKWTSDYKTWLESLIVENLVTEMSEYHTDVTVSFSITLSDAEWKKAKEQGLRSYFKLETTLSTSNMVLFDKSGKIKRYENTSEILKEFYEVRYDLYVKRKAHLLSVLNGELDRIDSRVKFIQLVIEDKIKLRNIKRGDLLDALKKYGLKPIHKQEEEKLQKGAPKDENEEEPSDVDEDETNLSRITPSKQRKMSRIQAKVGSIPTESREDSITRELRGYQYLTSMPLMSLTYEKVQELLKEKLIKEEEIEILNNTTIREMWNSDLDDFLALLDLHEAKEAEELRAGEAAKNQQGNAKKYARKIADSFDDDDDDSDSDDWNPKKKRAPVRATAAASKKTLNIPQWILRMNQQRPQQQQFIVEEETEKERKKRERQEASLHSQFENVSLLLGGITGSGGDDDVAATGKKATAAKKTTTAKATKSTTAKPAAKGRGKKKAMGDDEFDDDFLSSDDEDVSDFMGDSDTEDYAPRRTTSATRKAATTTTAKKTAVTKPATTATKAAPARKTSKKKSQDDDDDDESSDMLDARDSDNDDDELEFKPVSSTSRKRKLTTRVVDSDSEDDFSDDDSYEAPKKPTAAKTTTAKAASTTTIKRAATTTRKTSPASTTASSTVKPTTTTTTTKKKPSSTIDDSDDDFDTQQQLSSTSILVPPPTTLALQPPRTLSLKERLAQRNSGSSSILNLLSSSSAIVPSSVSSTVGSSSLQSTIGTSSLGSLSSSHNSNTLSNASSDLENLDSNKALPTKSASGGSRSTASANAKKATAATTKRQKTNYSEDYDDDDDDDDDHFDVTRTTSTASSSSRSRRAVASRGARYVISSDDDDDDDDDDDYDDYSD